MMNGRWMILTMRGSLKVAGASASHGNQWEAYQREAAEQASHDPKAPTWRRLVRWHQGWQSSRIRSPAGKPETKSWYIAELLRIRGELILLEGAAAAAPFQKS